MKKNRKNILTEKIIVTIFRFFELPFHGSLKLTWNIMKIGLSDISLLNWRNCSMIDISKLEIVLFIHTKDEQFFYIYET